jgi:hypothetical protein
MVDKIHIPDDFECYTPFSEPLSFCLNQLNLMHWALDSFSVISHGIISDSRHGFPSPSSIRAFSVEVLS